MKNCFLKQRKVIEGTIFLYFLIKCHLLAGKQLAVSCTAGGQINISVTWGLWKKAPQTCSCQQLFFPPFFFALLLNFIPFHLFSSSSSFLLLRISMPQARHCAPPPVAVAPLARRAAAPAGRHDGARPSLRQRWDWGRGRGLASSRKLPHCLSINGVFNKRLRGSPAN